MNKELLEKQEFKYETPVMHEFKYNSFVNVKGFSNPNPDTGDPDTGDPDTGDGL